SRRRHTRFSRDWSSDVCSSDLCRRVDHDRKRSGQGVENLLGPGDAVEVARDRTEAVVGADRRVAEILDLLEHRVRTAARIDVSRGRKRGAEGQREKRMSSGVQY